MFFHCEPQDLPGITRITYGRDPDGNIAELQQVKDLCSPIALNRPKWRKKK
jgi:hypothetical protein